MNDTSNTRACLITRYERIFKAYNEARKMLGHEHPTTIKLAADVLDAKAKLDACTPASAPRWEQEVLL